MRLRSLLLALAIGATAVAGSPGAGRALPAGSAWEEVYLPSLDGTPLHGDLLRPAGGRPPAGCPAIVSIGPYFGSGSQSSPIYSPFNAQPSSRFSDFTEHDFPGRGNIFAQGYAWLQVDSRGYGGSGGCNDFGGIGEQMDAVAAVGWAGTRPWSNGKVGMWGKSYDGWTQVMALAHSPPHLEAVVIQSPLIEGYGIGWVNGVHHSASWYATPSLYMAYDYLPPSASGMSAEEALYPAAGTATDPCWVENQALSVTGWDHDLEYWRERDLRARAGRNDDVAVLWSHGFNDVNTKPDQIFGVYEPLNALPDSNHRAWFGQWAHDRGNEAGRVGRDGFLEEAIDWFDHHLKGLPFRWSANERNVVEIQDNEGVWRTEAVYPPADVNRVRLPVRAGAYTDDGQESASAGYWTFSQPLPYAARVAGEPSLEVTVETAGPWASVVGVLYDYDDTLGQATEISRGARRLEGDGTVTFRLHPRDHVLRPGHRLAIHVLSGHPEFAPHSTRTTVGVLSAAVTVPFLTYERAGNLAGGRAAARAYSLRPTMSQVLGGELAMPLPPPMIRYPTDEVRESVQPTVTTPGG